MSFKSSEAEIRKLLINSTIDKTRLTNMTNITSQMIIYEDLFSPNISCNMNINDGVGFVNTNPIVGGEVVDMNVGIIGQDKNIRSLNAKFVVFKLSGKQRIKSDVEVYTLNLITPEQFLDLTTTINRAFVKPIHEIMQDIVKEYLTPISGKKLVSFEETKGIQYIVSTGLTVNAFLQQLVREAESITNPSSTYVFYETLEGYHFDTIDGLYDNPPKHSFVRDEIDDSPAVPKEMGYLNNVISFINVDNSFNLLYGQMSGQFGSIIETFDPLTKTFKKSVYSYKGGFVEDQTENEYEVVSEAVIKRYLSTPTIKKYITTNAHRAGVNYITERETSAQNIYRRRQDFMAKERSTLQQYGSMRVTISVPGNPDIIAGQTLQLTIPRSDDTVGGKRLNDKFISGKYIATAVSHNIDLTTTKYATVVECMRRGYESDIDTITE